jgi:hypothetical protein
LIVALLTSSAGTFAEESTGDVMGRWLGATDAAVQSFGKAGGKLTNIVTGQFTGVSKTISAADWAAVAGAASARDMRGAVSGAAAIVVGGKVTAAGAALFGEAGSVAGGAVGSFFPVVGNIAGSIVGGAVGTAAGGFICAFGYDKYVKDYVAKGVTGIVSVFDEAPLDQAMQAKRAFLWDTMAPEERAKLQGFNPEEVELLDFGTLPYVLTPKQSTSEAQQPGGLTTGDVLAGVRKFKIGEEIWEISGGIASQRIVRASAGSTQVQTSRGTVSVNRIEGTQTRDWGVPGHRCKTVVRETVPFVLVFTAESVHGDFKAGPVQVVSDSCRRGWAKATEPYQFTAPWQKLE